MDDVIRIVSPLGRFEEPGLRSTDITSPQFRQAIDDPQVVREWLVTNGLGGYASGTVAGFITRRFHGLLVSALPAPFGRTMMLNHLSETVVLGDQRISLSAHETPDGSLSPSASEYLAEFRLEHGLPVWRFELPFGVLEKRLLLPHRQNTVILTYRFLEGGTEARLQLDPWVHFRRHEGSLSAPLVGPYALTVLGDRYELATPDLPPLRIWLEGATPDFRIVGRRVHSVQYQIERSRGYDAVGELYSPGSFSVGLRENGTASLVASTEAWDAILALAPATAAQYERRRRDRLLACADRRARHGAGAELVLAADQFMIQPAGRLGDAARANALGDEVRTVIAGYPWFTDWGRDTMISLEGLALTTGRHSEAAYILRTFAHYVKDGLIPNMFPEGDNAGLYHTADATLWFFHAIDRYVEVTGDTELLRFVLPTLVDIIDHHVAGTSFGIRLDPDDGLLRQGQEGYQLTWMDAKIGDDVVTPRRGKAVEINALWYNAIRLLHGWLPHGSAKSDELAAIADKTYRSFQDKFWYAEGGYLYDVVECEGGINDPACRPNQVLSFSLRHPVLQSGRWAAVLEVVHLELLTPVGLRSLSRHHPEYKPQYFGDLKTRDYAYHQGTVWAWLIGPFIDAWLRVHPGDLPTARSYLQGLAEHLHQACIGSISEIFDAEAPFTPRGCTAQAWSVAEVLRCWVRTA